MKKVSRALTSALLMTAGLVGSARAQFLVFDPSTYGQSVLTAANTLEQINNQIKSLQNEATSLLNQAQSLANQGKNLTSLVTSPLAALQQDIAKTQQLIRQAEGLTTQIGQLDAQFRLQYPTGYGAGTSSSKTLTDAQTQWSNSLAALRTTLQMQATINDSISTDQNTLTSISGSSQGAVGILQATQATNQFLALLAKQTMQSQQLRIATDRATASEQLRMMETEAQGQANRQRFQGSGVAYTPAPVQVFAQ